MFVVSEFALKRGVIDTLIRGLAGEKNASKTINKVLAEVDIKKIWYNIYLNGEYQEEHDHLGGIFNQAHFSFIHFLCFDERDHKPPEFRDPLSQLRNLSLELDSNKWGEVYVPKVREGDLLMFPSYLQHSVPAGNKTSYPRITLSFNISVTRYGEDIGSN